MSQETRTNLLYSIAEGYVREGLGGKNFDAIPYHDAIVLRAPIHPEGSKFEMSGKAFIKENWWAPLPDLVDKTTLINTFVDKDLTAVTVEFHLYITEPACVLRIIDRFIIDDDGLITSQENFFDPREITNPS